MKIIDAIKAYLKRFLVVNLPNMKLHWRPGRHNPAEKSYWCRIFFPRLLRMSHNRIKKAIKEDTSINNDDAPCSRITEVSAPVVKLSCASVR